VWSVMQKTWPIEDSPLEAHNGYLKVPVLTGLRKGNDHTHYLLGANMEYEAFRNLLTGAKIGTGTETGT